MESELNEIFIHYKVMKKQQQFKKNRAVNKNKKKQYNVS